MENRQADLEAIQPVTQANARCDPCVRSRLCPRLTETVGNKSRHPSYQRLVFLPEREEDRRNPGQGWPESPAGPLWLGAAGRRRLVSRVPGSATERVHRGTQGPPGNFYRAARSDRTGSRLAALL